MNQQPPVEPSPRRPRRSRIARLLPFEEMLGYANQLGPYAGETGPSGEAPGTFPQAYTHLALISTAFNLDPAFEGTAQVGKKRRRA